MRKINYFFITLTLLLVILSAEIFVLVKLKVISQALAEKAIHKIPKVLIVESGSMEPTIKTGSLVFSLPSDTYKQGDIVTFKQSAASKTLVTHRIVYKYDNDFFTKGDANKTIDNGRVSKDQIAGKVIFSVPHVGYLGNFAKTPQGFILLVIVPATIIIYEEFLYLKGEITKLIAKRKKNNPSTTKRRLPKAAILIPLFSILIVIAGVTGSYFADTEKSSGNKMQAAGPASPTPSPTPTPSETPI